jgi:hypothetical protein
MTAVGKDTLLCVSRRIDRRTVWIRVGRTVGEITAVSYDSEKDQAVIEVRGRRMTIMTRDSAGTSAPAPLFQPSE